MSNPYFKYLPQRIERKRRWTILAWMLLGAAIYGLVQWLFF